MKAFTSSSTEDFVFLAKVRYHLNIDYLLSAHIKKPLLSLNVY